MIAASPVDHWWTLFEHCDVVISQGCRTFYNEPATSRVYRKTFDTNNLPDVYNAITYWRLSHTAKEFFGLVRKIFNHFILLFSVNVIDGEVFPIVKISRLHMGAYLCIASNGIPPSISKRVEVKVQCKLIRKCF